MSRKIKKLDAKTAMQLRQDFYSDIEAGKLSLSDALKQMRKIAGMTQTEYAQLIGITPRVLMDIEREKGNPRLDTLNKLGKPFGLKLGFSTVKK